MQGRKIKGLAVFWVNYIYSRVKLIHKKRREKKPYTKQMSIFEYETMHHRSFALFLQHSFTRAQTQAHKHTQYIYVRIYISKGARTRTPGSEVICGRKKVHSIYRHTFEASANTLYKKNKRAVEKCTSKNVSIVCMHEIKHSKYTYIEMAKSRMENTHTQAWECGGKR